MKSLKINLIGLAHIAALGVLAWYTHEAVQGIRLGSQAEFTLQIVVTSVTAVIALSFIGFNRRYEAAKVRARA